MSFNEVLITGMEVKEYSKKEKLAWLGRVKEALEREGFQTTWRNPFFDWINKVLPKDKTEDLTKEDLYLTDPPVPQVAPFDFVMVRIEANHYGSYFELEITFNPPELQQARKPEEFQTVWERHDGDWLIKLIKHFSCLEGSHDLNWDVEYQDGIMDSLYGSFTLDEEGIGYIIALMRDMKSLFDLESRRYVSSVGLAQD